MEKIRDAARAAAWSWRWESDSRADAISQVTLDLYSLLRSRPRACSPGYLFVAAKRRMLSWRMAEQRRSAQARIDLRGTQPSPAQKLPPGTGVLRTAADRQAAKRYFAQVTLRCRAWGDRGNEVHSVVRAIERALLGCGQTRTRLTLNGSLTHDFECAQKGEDARRARPKRELHARGAGGKGEPAGGLEVAAKRRIPGEMR